MNINIAGTSGNNSENLDATISSDNSVPNIETHDTSKLISAITEYIPTFFSPNGVLTHGKEDEYNLNIVEIIGQCELFFHDHPSSFSSDENKCSFIIHKLKGPAKKWGLSLKADGTLLTLGYNTFKNLLIENFGDSDQQRYSLIEKLLVLKQKTLGKAAFFTIEFRRLAKRIGWDDRVNIDLIRRGLLEEVRKEFDKAERPENLFEATNLIITLDKKCYLEESLKFKNKITKTREFKRKHYEDNKFKHNRNHKRNRSNEILSANYTPNKVNSMTCIFTLTINNKKLKIRVLIDSGSARSFICQNFVRSNKIPYSGLSSSVNIKLPNDKSMNIKNSTKPLKLSFMDHVETFEFLIANLQLQGISGILGRDWLNKHKPYINFEKNSIYFLEKYCIDHCESSRGNKFVFHSKEFTASLIPEETLTYDNLLPEESEDENNQEICAATQEIFVDESEKQSLSTKENIIQNYYPSLKQAFEKSEADKLPPHRSYDMSIELIPGSQLFYGPIYSVTNTEMGELKKYIKENLQKGFIRKSNSPAGAPILFVKKHDGSYRICIDYRKLNSITVRNSYPIPRINDLIESFQGAVIFTRLDLRSAYNLIRIKEGQEYLTAFRTPIGHFEYLVMPFGLRNAPSVFQRFVQDIFSNVIGEYVQIYLDDIIIYSKNEEEHVKQVSYVLQKLIKNRLFAKLEKCDLHVRKTKFLGFIVSAKGLTMDEDKLKSIMEWPIPNNVKELQSFLGLCNFYRRFIKNFAEIMEPLRRLLRKETIFNWDTKADEAFNKLKESFSTNNLLIHPDHNKEFVVETDASDFAIGCVLSQRSDEDNLLHPVAFYSRSMSPAESNYTIYDKELLGIITALEVWRHHLEGSKLPFQILTDHKNLLYFRKPQHLNQRQIRWGLFLSKFNYRISFRPGEKAGKPDALSRRPDYKLNHINEEKIRTTLLKKEDFCCTTIENIDKLIEEQKKDKYCRGILSKLHENNFKSVLFKMIKGILHFQKKIIVPSTLKAQLLYNYHDTPTNGHQGVSKTLEKLQRFYWWPNMRNDVTNYVHSCTVCGKNKVRRHKPYGKIQPLPVPNRPWEIIGVDFIVYLPNSQNHTCIMVVVDHLTKMLHLVPCVDVPSAELTAKLLLDNVFRFHGFPRIIVSDHGSQFSSEFWTSLCYALQVKPKLATAHHQQSNGQVERTNATIEQYLRCYCSSAQTEWYSYLPLCELAYNNSIHKSIGMTPFYANYGFNPCCNINSPPILLKDNASSLTRNWAAHFDSMKKHLIRAKDDYKKYGDVRKSSGPKLSVNDKVWLKRFYFTNEPARKLANQYLGPFRILEVRDRLNYRLELPENMHLHPIFHISQLEPYTERNKDLLEENNNNKDSQNLP